MTIYVPDDLAAEVKAELGESNVSAVCQDALRDELRRVRARAKVAKDGFQRVEAYSSRDDEDVAFQGREIGYDPDYDATAYLTPKGAIVVVDGQQEELLLYRSYEEFVGGFSGDRPDSLPPQVAKALGERFVRELDI